MVTMMDPKTSNFDLKSSEVETPSFLAVKGSYGDNGATQSLWRKLFLFVWDYVLQFILSDIVRVPLLAIGYSLEFALNVIDANGGFISTIYRLLLCWTPWFRLVVRWRDDEQFATLISVMDRRITLLAGNGTGEHGGHLISDPENQAGSRDTADILMMASKLVYENEAYNKRVVSTIWKMNFVGFYNCWNEYFKEAETQVLMFTDRPENAKAVVIAFRGTEPFNTRDWATDFNFKRTHPLKGVGKVHVGFWEALGLGTRAILNNDQLTPSQKQADGVPLPGLTRNVYEDRTKKLAYYYVTDVVKELMKNNPDAKLYVTGHSLGAALAALYTTVLYLLDETKITNRLGGVYTFGQPRIGDTAFSQYMANEIDKSKHFRVVYGNDLVPRVPFDDFFFQSKHCGLCYYSNSVYNFRTLKDAPYRNYFSTICMAPCRFISLRVTALYEVVQSFLLWIFNGPEYKETFESTIFRLLGLILPGIAAHGPANYINAVRLSQQFPLVPVLSPAPSCFQRFLEKIFPWLQ